MTPLRKRMIEEMELRNFAPKTVALYVDNVAKFARHFNKSPESLGEEDVRQYLLHLVEERKLAWGTYNQALAALRYLYRWVLERGGMSSGTSADPAASDTCRWCSAWPRSAASWRRSSRTNTG